MAKKTDIANIVKTDKLREVRLAIIGVSETADWCDLSVRGRELLLACDWLMGAERHLGKARLFMESALGEGSFGKIESHSWGSPLSESIKLIVSALKSGRRAVVLATGDAMNYGIGATLLRELSGCEWGGDMSDIEIIPALGAFSHATSRLGWASQDCVYVSLHGRALASLRCYLAPRARLLVLSRDGRTPYLVGKFLQEHGYGDASMHVLCDLGSEAEAIYSFDNLAQLHAHEADFPPLNTIALQLGEGASGCPLPPYLLLRDEDLQHDGQITKAEVRAITLLRLRPFRGGHLWDLGAGCGSVSLGWILAGGYVSALERDSRRCDFIMRNVEAWGMSDSITVHETEIDGFDFDYLSGADAIFWGGGIGSLELLENSFNYLKTGGIFVVNAVTLEACERVHEFRKKHGGELARLRVEKPELIGHHEAFRPSYEVLQFWLRKGENG